VVIFPMLPTTKVSSVMSPNVTYLVLEMPPLFVGPVIACLPITVLDQRYQYDLGSDSFELFLE